MRARYASTSSSLVTRRSSRALRSCAISASTTSKRVTGQPSSLDSNRLDVVAPVGRVPTIVADPSEQGSYAAVTGPAASIRMHRGGHAVGVERGGDRPLATVVDVVDGADRRRWSAYRRILAPAATQGGDRVVRGQRRRLSAALVLIPPARCGIQVVAPSTWALHHPCPGLPSPDVSPATLATCARRPILLPCH